MPQFLDSMINTIMGSVPGSPQQQVRETAAIQNQNTDLMNQSLAFKLGQEKLAASANNQLMPLQIEATKNKLQEEIGKAQLSLFMQPYQKEMVKSALTDSVVYGSDGKSGLTGIPDIDAQIQKIMKDTTLSVALNPEHGVTQWANATRAMSELRKAGEERKHNQTVTVIQSVATTPRDSLLRIAEAQPDNPQYQFIKQAISSNPNITNTELQSQLSRVFAMDPEEREKLGFREKELNANVHHWEEENKRKKEEFKMANDTRLYAIEEKADANRTTQDRLKFEKDRYYDETHRNQISKLDQTSNTIVSKALDKYSEFNTKDTARGAGSTISAIQTLQNITNGAPVTPENVFTAISRNSAPDASVDANQIAALNTVKAQMAKYYTNNGQKSVTDILGSTRAAGIVPSVANKVDAWLFGGGNTQLKDKNERLQFSTVLSKVYDQMVENVSNNQIEKSNIALTDPYVTPEHKSRFARNILEDPNSLQPTKINTAKKLFEDLSQKGARFTPEDANIATKILAKIQNPGNKQQYNIAAEQLLKLYNKYGIKPEQSTPAILSNTYQPKNNPSMPDYSNAGIIIPPPLKGR